MTNIKSLLNNQWVVAGAIGLIGAYVFKDQLCPVIDIPGICGSGDGLQARDTPNCDSKTKMCVCPHGNPFQMGAKRTCKDCARACGGTLEL